MTLFTPNNAIYPETAIPQCYLRWRHGVHNSVIVATFLMGGLAQFYDPPTPTMQWLMGKQNVSAAFTKSVSRLLVLLVNGSLNKFCTEKFRHYNIYDNLNLA